MADDRDNTWRKAQKQAFGRRLTAARKAMKGPDGKPLYKRTADFIEAIKERVPDARIRSYYSHEAGDRVPQDDATIELYAEMLDTTSHWLLFGTGEDVNDETLKDDAATINQANEVLDINPSKIVAVRYIPLLTASDIKKLLFGNGNLTAMSRDQLPMPQNVAVGARAFYYQIPDHDTSMVSATGQSFAPGTLLLIDQDRDVAPGDFLLAQLADMPAPVMRRLQSAYVLSSDTPRYPFKLLALNPMAEPVIVHKQTECQVIGRVVSFTQIL